VSVEVRDSLVRPTKGGERTLPLPPPGGPAPSRDAALRVAYLVNQYPKVSHSFIRREIRALEAQGLIVDRIAVRGWDSDVVDAEDAAEKTRTAYVLERGMAPVAASLLRALLARPGRVLSALATAIRLSFGADRPMPYHLVYVAEACWVLERIRHTGAGHLHAHFGTNPAEVALYVRLLGGPSYSFTVHGPEEFDKADLLKLRSKMAQARFVVAISSYGRSQLYRLLDLEDWKKVEVVHCGLDPAFYEGHGRPQSLARRLVCVGRLCEQKGQLLLLDAFRIVADLIADAVLVLAGDGEMRSALEARIRDLDLTGRVHITGWISSEQVRDEILASRALVLPSFQEGLPVVLMEAMALRRPVISTFVAGIPELVTPETGWLVPAGDVGSLAQAMQAALEAPADELSRRAEAGFARVTARHAIEPQAAALAGLFAASARA
jgi:colanic acid/amylovoran biosynthesis glycosyltransferase